MSLQTDSQKIEFQSKTFSLFSGRDLTYFFQEWIEILSHMDDQSLSCVESTLDGSMRCDIQMWQNLKVPLLGLWGDISYAPAMVRRQIGSKQFITSGGGLRATISSCLPIHNAFTQDSTLDLDIEFRDFSLNSSIEDKDEDCGVC